MKWTGSKQISRPDKRKWTQSLTQNKAPCVIVICRENNFPFYTKECHWIHLSHLRLWPMPMSVQAAQNTLHFLLILCDFWLVLPLHLGKHFLVFCLIFSFNMCVLIFSFCCFARCCSSCLPFFQQIDIEA